MDHHRKRPQARVLFSALALACSITSGCRDMSGPAHGGSIRVDVTLDGSPAPGTHVVIRNSAGSIMGEDGSTPEFVSSTGGTTGGTLTAGPLLPGTFKVTVIPPGSSKCTPTEHTVVVGTRESVVVKFTCVTMGVITGSVTIDGSPQPGISVHLSQESNAIGNATTGSAGTYEFPDLPVGSYSVRITRPADVNCPVVEQTVTVTAAVSPIADFACTRPTTGTISLQVNSGGTPLSGANVTVTGGTVTRTATTGASGAVQFADLPPGQYTVGVAISGKTCISQVANVIVAQTASVTVICDPNPGIVTGVVTVDDVPTGGVKLTISNDLSMQNTVTSQGGVYVFQGLSVTFAAWYVVYVEPPEGTTCSPASQGVIVESDKTAVLADFACTRAAGPTVPAGVLIGGNWTYVRVFVSQSGACGAQLGGAGAGTMTFNANNNVIFATGFDPDNGVSGPYNQMTGGWTGTGTRIFSGGITLQTTVTGNFGLSISANPTFGGVMTQRYTGNSDCVRAYDVSGVRGN